MHTSYQQVQKAYYVYTILSLKDLTIYTGLTTSLSVRLKEHSRGLVTETMIRIPFKLIHYEYFIHLDDAKKRVGYLRTLEGRSRLKESLKYTLQSRHYSPFRLHR